MPDVLSEAQRHECMSHVHSRDTGPERAVRRELWCRGYRYRLNVRKLPGTPDIVLAKYRTVIFVNGCFWHGHKGCPKFVMPKSNVEFWSAKIARNQARDLLNTQRLESLAWSVVTVWECELSADRIGAATERVEAELREGLARWDEYNAKRRENRAFALSQARRHREIIAQVEAELAAQTGTPFRFREPPDDGEATTFDVVADGGPGEWEE